MESSQFRIRNTVVLILLFSVAILAQKPGIETPHRTEGSSRAFIRAEAEQRLRKWQTRVDDFTKEIVSESSAVSDSERAVYLAQVAKIWWKIDEIEARSHLNKAADKLRAGMEKDIDARPGMRLFNFQKTIQIISGLDVKLAQKLIASLEKFSEDNDANRKPDEDMADLFASVGLTVVGANPQMAAALGYDSLRYGFATQLPALVVEINLKEPLLAESLTRNALTLARNSTARSSFLVIFNFDRYMSKFNKSKTFPDALRRSVVETFMDVVSTAAMIEQERSVRCKVAVYAKDFIPRVEEYFPAMLIVFRQNLEICLPYTSATNQEHIKFAGNDELKTPDDLIRAARETKDPNLKITYYRQALKYYEDKKQFEEMISILEGVDGDDFKEIAPIGWGMWRAGASSDGAIASFEANDLPAAYRLIDKTPKSLRPYVRKELVGNSSVAKNKEFLLENMEEMQKELNALDFPVGDAVGIYLLLTRLYITVRPTECESIFRNAVKYINKTDNDNPDFAPAKDWAIYEDIIPMKSELLEIDEPSITSSLNNLSSRRSRVRLKLGLLESSLKEYVDAKKRLDEIMKKKPAASTDTKSTKPPPKP